MTDGEGVERLWSFLRRFSSVTKEMSAHKRTDVLTDGLLHYAQHLYHKFGMVNFIEHITLTFLWVLLKSKGDINY